MNFKNFFKIATLMNIKEIKLLIDKENPKYKNGRP